MTDEPQGAGPVPAPADPPPFPKHPLLSSERIYDSPWVGLRRDMIELGGGRPQEHHVVEIGPAVSVVPVRTDGRLVLVGQYRHPHGETHWEVPAGRLDGDEVPAMGAHRELREETGHTTKELIPLPGFYPINGISDHWCHPFLALDCDETDPLDLDPAERLIVQTFSRAEVNALLASGRIVDGFSALALHKGLAVLDARS